MSATQRMDSSLGPVKPKAGHTLLREERTVLRAGWRKTDGGTHQQDPNAVDR